MGFSLYNLFKAGLLATNAIAILHPKRFLARYKLDQIDPSSGPASVGNQMVGFLQAVSYLRIPLIAVNIFIIFIEIIIGWYNVVCYKNANKFLLQ